MRDERWNGGKEKIRNEAVKRDIFRERKREREIPNKRKGDIFYVQARDEEAGSERSYQNKICRHKNKKKRREKHIYGLFHTCNKNHS